MFRTISDFTAVWEQERESALKFLDQLTDETLNQQVTSQMRTLGRVAWHLTATLPEMMSKVGFEVSGVNEDDPVPGSAKAIAESYREASQSLLDQVTADWTDDTLSIEDDLYGQKWTRGRTLFILIIHQTHHLGQMSVLMRQAGLKVPGIYGPAKEEWAQFGMSEPEV